MKWFDSLGASWPERNSMRYFCLTLICISCIWGMADARKISVRHSNPTKKKAKTTYRTHEKENDERIVSRDSDSLIFCSIASRLRLSGYAKTLRSGKESITVTNNSEVTLRGVTLEITYLSTDGKMIHKRTVTLPATLPAGESRTETFPTWDIHHFHYYAGGTAPTEKTKGKAIPFEIALRLISVSL